MKLSEYKPVTVQAASEIARVFNKDVVVVMAIDRTHDKTHFTSYGRSADDKIQAAEFCELISGGLGCPGPLERFEDFRSVDAAKRAEDIENARRALRWALAQFEGSSGAGLTIWMEIAEFRAARVAAGLPEHPENCPCTACE